MPSADIDTPTPLPTLEVRVRRIHRRDLNRTWEFIKKVFRDVNLETVEFQRPRTKRRFLEVYEEEDIEQLLFEVGDEIVGYAECAVESVADDSWVNPRYFEKRDMRPLFVEELATHPDYQGQGIGSYMMEQLEHLARVRGCTHLVLEVAENNEAALAWYRKRNFYKLDAAIFLARRIESPPELLPPRGLTPRPKSEASPRKKSKRMPRSIAVVSIDGPPPAPAKAEDDDERAAPHALHATKKSSKSATKTAPRKPAKKAPAKSTKKVTKVAKVAKSTAPKPAASKDVVHANGASKDGTSSS